MPGAFHAERAQCDGNRHDAQADEPDGHGVDGGVLECADSSALFFRAKLDSRLQEAGRVKPPSRPESGNKFPHSKSSLTADSGA